MSVIYKILHYILKIFIKNTPNVDTVLKIYLREHDSDNLMVFEIFNPSFLDNENLFYNFKNFEIDDNLRFWYAAAFDAVESSDDITDPRFSATDNPYTHRYKFNHQGIELTHFMKVHHYLDLPSAVGSSSEGSFIAKTSIVDEGVLCPSAPNEETKQSCFQLDNVRIDAAIDKGDAFRQAKTNGNVVKPWGVSVKVNIGSNTVALTDHVSVTLNYNGYEEHIFDESSKLFTNSTKYTRQACGILKDNFFIDDKNHYFETIFYDGNYDHKNRDINYFRIKYSYIVTNRLKYNDTHEFKMNLTKTYKSEHEK